MKVGALKQWAPRSPNPGASLTELFDPSAPIPERRIAVGPGLLAHSSPGRIQLFGVIDLVNVQEFRAAITRGAQDTAGALVLDLAEVTFLDSAALGTLYAFARELLIELVVWPGSFVERVLLLARLDRVLRIVRL